MHKKTNQERNKRGELTELSKKYDIPLSVLCRYRKKGIDIYDEHAVQMEHSTTAQGQAQKSKTISIRKLSLNDKLGLKASIERLEEAERHAAKSYEDAIASGDLVNINHSFRYWNSISDTLRKISIAHPQILQEESKTVELAVLKKDLNELFSSVRTILQNLPRRLSPELVGKDVITIQQLLEHEINQTIHLLSEGSFLANE